MISRSVGKKNSAPGSTQFGSSLSASHPVWQLQASAGTQQAGSWSLSGLKLVPQTLQPAIHGSVLTTCVPAQTALTQQSHWQADNACLLVQELHEHVERQVKQRKRNYAIFWAVAARERIKKVTRMLFQNLNESIML